jgi:hypothetical protein
VDRGELLQLRDPVLGRPWSQPVTGPSAIRPPTFAIRRIERGSRPPRSAASSIARTRSARVSGGTRGRQGTQPSTSRPVTRTAALGGEHLL